MNKLCHPEPPEPRLRSSRSAKDGEGTPETQRLILAGPLIQSSFETLYLIEILQF
jgi:hypothetical protein